MWGLKFVTFQSCVVVPLRHFSKKRIVVGKLSTSNTAGKVIAAKACREKVPPHLKGDKFPKLFELTR